MADDSFQTHKKDDLDQRKKGERVDCNKEISITLCFHIAKNKIEKKLLIQCLVYLAISRSFDSLLCSLLLRWLIVLNNTKTIRYLKKIVLLILMK